MRTTGPLFSAAEKCASLLASSRCGGATPAAEGTRARFLGGQRAHHPMGRPRVCAHIPYPAHPFPFRAAGRGSADPDQHGSNGSDGRTRHARALLPDANCSSAYIRVCLMTLVPRSLRCACGRCVGEWALGGPDNLFLLTTLPSHAVADDGRGRRRLRLRRQAQPCERVQLQRLPLSPRLRRVLPRMGVRRKTPWC